MWGNGILMGKSFCQSHLGTCTTPVDMALYSLYGAFTSIIPKKALKLPESEAVPTSTVCCLHSLVADEISIL